MERRFFDFFNPDLARRMGCTEEDPFRKEGSGEDPLVTGLEYDSRKVKPGNLYFALPGLHADGQTFIPQAVRAGARVIVLQRPPVVREPNIFYIKVRDSRFAMSPAADAFYGSPSAHLGLVGVTGTEGKSTTVYLIFQLLRLLGKRAGFISTVQFSDGGDEQWNPEHQTTPEATALHRLLGEMRDRGAEYAVLESSSHGLSSKTNRLGDVAFDVGVMTNVTHEHLEFHGTWEQYRHDKANLFRALDRDGPGAHVKLLRREEPVRIPAFAVANGDDPSAAYFAAATGRRTYTYSTRGAKADLAISGIESGALGNRYTIRDAGTGRTLTAEDRLPGAFNGGNVLAAMLTLSGLLDLPAAELVPLIPRLKPVRGRMTAVLRGQPFEVLVDYAHTPSSFETIFPPLRERLGGRAGRILCLFGSAGERDTAKRPEQGRIASRWSDLLFLTDEDPRGEDPMGILREIAAGCAGRRPGEDLFLIPNRPEAIRKAFSLARPGDLVLLLGKGHENSIIGAEGPVPYDEIGEAEKALAELGYCGVPV
ncbi:MAG: UDP-N-acetylmuramoyl-L-alanyl-D-glutamate--2,6-diaminopimelate ligase [Spirochaetaceae bacterium]|jgi:UDP-N-acetylmuramoyl-L-alanyl-D-glutamate--2,6-diaminopimelate ligase|nr:UDP-N-acetylmuramoyl-L-alanyl-D-glutamate--2,6-diaminopimelate ligase [Spirochaetaceae bacterium]